MTIGNEKKCRKEMEAMINPVRPLIIAIKAGNVIKA